MKICRTLLKQWKHWSDDRCVRYLKSEWGDSAGDDSKIRRKENFTIGRRRWLSIIQIIDRMVGNGAQVGPKVFSSCISKAGMMKSTKLVGILEERMENLKIPKNHKLRVAISSAYAEDGRTDVVLNELGKKDAESVYFNILLKSYRKNKEQRLALSLFDTIPVKKRDSKTYLFVITCCRNWRITSHILSKMHLPRLRLHYNAAMTVASRTPSIEGVIELYKKMRAERIEPDASTYNILIEGYAARGMFREIDFILSKITTPTPTTYINYIRGMCKCIIQGRGDSTILVAKAEAAFSVARGKGLDTFYAYTALMSVYGATSSHQNRAAKLYELYHEGYQGGYLPYPADFFYKVASAAAKPYKLPVWEKSVRLRDTSSDFQVT